MLTPRISQDNRYAKRAADQEFESQGYLDLVDGKIKKKLGLKETGTIGSSHFSAQTAYWPLPFSH